MVSRISNGQKKFSHARTGGGGSGGILSRRFHHTRGEEEGGRGKLRVPINMGPNNHWGVTLSTQKLFGFSFVLFKGQPDCLPFPPLFFDWSHNVPLPPPPNFHGLGKEYLSNGFSVVLCSGIQFRDKNAPPIFTTFYFHGCR